MSGEAPASYADLLRHALALPPADRRMLVDDVARSLAREESRPEESAKAEEPSEEVKGQRERALELMEELDKLPLHDPKDGLSGCDHDLILYGWRK